MKICADCKHYRVDIIERIFGLRGHCYKNKKITRNLITGKKEIEGIVFAEIERKNFSSTCGYDGRFWEPK